MGWLVVCILFREDVCINYLEKPMEVEEGEILSFHFTNYTEQSLFVYILCLEETGTCKLACGIDVCLGGGDNPLQTLHGNVQ